MESVESKPLSNYPVLATSDMDEAHDAVERIYLSHQLDSFDPGPMAMKLNAFEHRRTTLGFLRYGRGVRVEMPPALTCYHINLTTRGQTFAECADGSRAVTTAETSGVILHPQKTNIVRWGPDAEQFILKIPVGVLQAYLTDALGRHVADAVDFDFRLDLSLPAGAGLLDMVRFLARELDRSNGAILSPLVLEPLQSALVGQVLVAAPNSFTDLLTQPPGVKLTGRRMKLVIDYIQAHADKALTPTKLARIAGVSLRTLHASFERSLKTTPMEYLREIRMNRARADLINIQNPDIRIIDLAMRWGFFHPSRFAQQYRQRYGELPSETVRRHHPGRGAEPGRLRGAPK